MSDPKSAGAQPAPKRDERRDRFFGIVAGAILMRQNGRSPEALARECRIFTDAFLAALDAPSQS